MSFQAYLDAVETKTGLTPRQIVDAAAEQGFGPDSKTMAVVGWLKETYVPLCEPRRALGPP